MKEDDEQALDQALVMEGFEKQEVVLGTAGVGGRLRRSTLGHSRTLSILRL